MAAAGRVSSVFRPNLFKDKVAIVTGGGTGIGKAITQELLYLGCKVMIASRKLDRLSTSAKLLQGQIKPGSPAELDHVQCNIRNEEQVQKLISTTISRFGKLDFLINNGGGQFPSPASSFSLKGWNAVIETNLTGTFLCCREAYNQWMEQHGGVIVNIIADMFKGFPTMSHTGAARAGVDNLTKSLAIEWAEKGVRINSVAPGSSIYSVTAAANYGDPDVFESIKTRVPAQRLGTVEEGLVYSETAAANYGDLPVFEIMKIKIPAHRLDTVEEVSSAVCYLLSPGASFISGATLRVDAGGSLYTNMWNVPKHDRWPAYTWKDDVDDDDDGTQSKL